MTETLFENGNGAKPAGQPVLRDFTDGERISAVFVVRERERRQKKNGDDFLRLVLADRTGSVPAIAWDRVAEGFEICVPGSIVLVGGRFSVHPQFGRQIKLASVRPAAPDEYDP
mgnify:CR=1 FL=1